MLCYLMLTVSGYRMCWRRPVGEVCPAWNLFLTQVHEAECSLLQWSWLLAGKHWLALFWIPQVDKALQGHHSSHLAVMSKIIG